MVDPVDEPVTIERTRIGEAPDPPQAGRTSEREAKSAVGIARTELATGHGRLARENEKHENEKKGEPSRPTAVNVDAAPISDAGFHARYEVRSLLGEGGMGEVRLCRDRRIGRDVALKVIRPGAGSRSDVRLRFEREARVQGQLEHPSIVPVYDLGIAPVSGGSATAGDAFFTMKRVRGHTIEEIVAGLRADDPSFVDRYNTRKLLTAFNQVGLAIAFAHVRGVLHRDLKPANVMLGDFGEVYVLDWGLAKLAAGDDAVAARGDTGADASPSALIEPPSVEGKTATGTIMGTPGYMAPEQVRGENDHLDARTDVYALGAILFEIVALTPLHDRRTTQEMLLISTLTGVEARPSLRVPERQVAPELEAICVRATALDPADRYPSVRALVDDVERFLDGDRDLARRKELAAQHAERATNAALRAAEGGAESATARSEAIREVNRALALDATHAGALSTMLGMLLDPPKETPPEAEAELQKTVAHERRTSVRIGSRAYLSWLIVVPFLFWQGMRNAACAACVAGMIVLSASLAMWLGRRNSQNTIGWGLAMLVTSTVAIGISSLHFGPFIDVPGMAAANTLVFAMHAARGRARKLTIAIGTCAVLVPVLLEVIGWLPPSYAFRDGMMLVLPRMTSFPALPTLLLLMVASIALVVVPSLLVGRLHDEATAANRRLFVHMWHLRQFIPDEARDASNVPESVPAEDACVVAGMRRRARA